MNPAAIRTAITDALGARPAFTGVTLFRYPPGDRADQVSGFVLGEVSSAEAEDTDLDGGTHIVDYDIEGGLWVAGDGADDDDYETVEAAAIALINDFQAWIAATGHGKRINVPAGVTVDSLELTKWEVTFTAETTAAIVDFTLEVSEIVT